MSTNDSNFQSTWLNDYNEQSLGEHFNEIRTFAYLVFDQIDVNRNGFIEIEELENALNSPASSERERSFITFLLQNHDAIAESFEDRTDGNVEGISRQDIEEYFKLIAELLA